VRAETRRSLKEDRFRGATIQVAERTAHWSVEHKSKLITFSIIVLVVLAAVLGTWAYLSSQDEKASVDLGAAVRTMETQVRPPGVPAQPNFPSFASSEERATAAKKEFQQVVDKYPHTHTADVARYFLGLTSNDLGDNATAERYLGEVASIHDKDLAGLAKFALAAVYRKENTDGQAVDLYKQLIDRPTATVAKVTAQMELASFYQSKQQTADAKRIYEQVQKENQGTEAGSLAGSKLTELK